MAVRRALESDIASLVPIYEQVGDYLQRHPFTAGCSPTTSTRAHPAECSVYLAGIQRLR